MSGRQRNFVGRGMPSNGAEATEALMTSAQPRGAATNHVRWRQALLVLFFVMALVACGGDDEATDPGSGVGNVPAGQPVLVCSQECRDRGQCGQTNDGTPTVLLNLEGPAVAPEEHDLAIAADTGVEVREVRTQTVVEQASGNGIPVNFYRVFIPERNTEGWTAAWCILNAPQ